jgi:hypothetical protein
MGIKDTTETGYTQDTRVALHFSVPVTIGTVNRNVGLGIFDRDKRVCAEVEATGIQACFVEIPSYVNFVNEGGNEEPLRSYVLDHCPLIGLAHYVQCPIY